MKSQIEPLPDRGCPSRSGHLCKLIVLLALLALTLLALLPAARSAPTPLAPQWGYWTNSNQLTNGFNGPLYVTNASYLVITNAYALPLYRGRGLALACNVTATNAAATNITWSFDVTYDGTNWTTGGQLGETGTGAVPLQWFVSLLGNTNTIRYTNILADKLDNIKAIRPAGVTGVMLGGCFVSNLVWSITP